MSEIAGSSSRTPEEIYAVVAAELRSRGAEVVRAIDATIPAIGPGIAEDADAEYQASRVAAITATVLYSLEAIEREGEWTPIPQALAQTVQ